jgi:hypothetical protein
MRYRDGSTEDWADIIDMLTLHPEERRRVARLPGELEGLGAFLDARESKVVGGEAATSGSSGGSWSSPPSSRSASVSGVMGSASEATAARGLSGVVVSLIVLAVGSFLVVRFRTS